VTDLTNPATESNPALAKLKRLEQLQSPTLELEGAEDALRSQFADVPEMGQLSALTDAILLLFQNIDARLTKYLTSNDASEKEELHKEIKQFLGRINSNHLIPLHFRLRVLASFSREASFLNADLTSAILNAYQVGILLLLEEAKEKEESNLALGLMCSQAIQLAMRVARLQLSQYFELGHQITAQVHTLARIGFAALMKCPESPKRQTHYENVRNALAWFELMRLSDFFRLTRSEQETVYKHIESCINKIAVLYVPKKMAVTSTPGHTYLVSNVGDRFSRPERVPDLDPVHKNDRVVLDISVLLPLLRDQLDEVTAHLEDSERQRRDLRIEDEIYATLMATRHMLNSMEKLPRKFRRDRITEDFTLVGNLESALKLINRPHVKLLPTGIDGKESDLSSSWSTFDMSSVGIGAETTDAQNLPQISSLVRLVWSRKDAEYPFWATLVWRRHLAVGIGRTRAGLQFLPGKPAVVQVHTPGRDKAPALAARMSDARELLLWVFGRFFFSGQTVLLDIGDKTYTCLVVKKVQQGNNYTSFQIRVMSLFHG